MDLANIPSIDKSEASVQLKNATGKSVYAFVSSYPEQVFNSQAYGSNILFRQIKDVLSTDCVVVIFATTNQDIHYDLAEIGPQGTQIVERFNCSTLRLCDGIGKFTNKTGKVVKLSKDNTFNSFLGKYIENAHYEVVFPHPTVYEKGDYVPKKNFFPLLLNGNDEIIGYLNFVSDGGLVVVLPQMEKKAELLVELFDNLAPILPKVFPYNGMFAWLDDGSYPLPGEVGYRNERTTIEQKYALDIAENEKKIVELKTEFDFLRVMLSGTGDSLVAAVREFFIWLGFSSAVAMDEHSENILEEDIQVQLSTGLLVIEVKGIGGTSKDKECAQISKIKNRRQEERQAWDVSALYIVNHQRYMPPKLRANPPFTDHQIRDAELDKRGLVTTYALYLAYLDVLSGLITKSDVQKQLLGFGYIKIVPPDLIEIGVAKEIFQNGSILILDLNGSKLTVGKKIYLLKNDHYEIREVLELRQYDTVIVEATHGEVGVKLNSPAKKGSRVFISK